MDNFKFEIIDEYKDWVRDTPQRASLGSAGYDLRVAETYTLVAGERHIFTPESEHASRVAMYSHLRFVRAMVSRKASCLPIR